jgi:hypothetical protein
VICVDFGVGVTQAYSELAALKGAKETVLGGRASSIHQYGLANTSESKGKGAIKSY